MLRPNLENVSQLIRQFSSRAHREFIPSSGLCTNTMGNRRHLGVESLVHTISNVFLISIVFGLGDSKYAKLPTMRRPCKQQ